MKSVIPSVDVCADLIGIPVTRWPGNCYCVAQAIVEAGLIEGRAVYGDYLGPVKEGTLFDGRGVIQHGWIEVDGQIVDPTRWVFEGASPYLHTCDLPNREYDEGAKQRRIAMMRPRPEPEGEELAWSKTLSDGLADLMGGARSGITEQEIFWLCNLSPDLWGECGPELVEWASAHGKECYFPIDSVEYVKHHLAGLAV